MSASSSAQPQRRTEAFTGCQLHPSSEATSSTGRARPAWRVAQRPALVVNLRVLLGDGARRNWRCPQRHRRLCHTSPAGRPNAGRSTSSTSRSPSDHSGPPQRPQSGLGARLRMCTRSGSPASSSTPSTSTSPSPTNRSQTRVGSHSTGILQIFGCLFSADSGGSLAFSRGPLPPPLRPHTRRAGLGRWEPRRTHWAVKTADLYRSLLRFFAESPARPSVFEIPSHLPIDDDLVSVMMPLSGEFDKVYTSIKKAASDVNLRCQRADEIWTSPSIMQDVVNLITRSAAVIVDCTGKNPNVFYEMGIAHTIGRSVIPITQSESDIPFDITHLRYIPYLKNREGRQKLREELGGQLRELTTR